MTDDTPKPRSSREKPSGAHAAASRGSARHKVLGWPVTLRDGDARLYVEFLDAVGCLEEADRMRPYVDVPCFAVGITEGAFEDFRGWRDG